MVLIKFYSTALIINDLLLTRFSECKTTLRNLIISSRTRVCDFSKLNNDEVVCHHF